MDDRLPDPLPNKTVLSALGMAKIQHTGSRYDDRAVLLATEIEDYLATLAPPLDPIVRRCGAIRRAIEMQVEHVDPPALPSVVELLSRALLEQVRLVAHDHHALEAALLNLRRHLEERTQRCSG